MPNPHAIWQSNDDEVREVNVLAACLRVIPVALLLWVAIVWFILWICTGPAMAAEPDHRDRAWPWLMGAYSAGVGADAFTTSRALDAGAQEGNPLLAWSGRDGVVPLRLALGAAVGHGLCVLHRSNPRLARRLAILNATLAIAIAVHNHQVELQQREGR